MHDITCPVLLIVLGPVYKTQVLSHTVLDLVYSFPVWGLQLEPCNLYLLLMPDAL